MAIPGRQRRKDRIAAGIPHGAIRILECSIELRPGQAPEIRPYASLKASPGRRQLLFSVSPQQCPVLPESIVDMRNPAIPLRSKRVGRAADKAVSCLSLLRSNRPTHITVDRRLSTDIPILCCYWFISASREAIDAMTSSNLGASPIIIPVMRP